MCIRDRNPWDGGGVVLPAALTKGDVDEMAEGGGVWGGLKEKPANGLVLDVT